MTLTWLKDGFICKDLYAPFVVSKDCEYRQALRKKYNLVLNQAIRAKADYDSIIIVEKYKKKVLEALKYYYKADVVRSYTIIKNLLRDIGEDPMAVAPLSRSYAFPGNPNQELQFFRCRKGNPASRYSVKDMLHLPEDLRSKSGNYRFSIPGNPSLYLANSSYGCWIETGFPPEIEFNVSPVLLDGTQRVFNLAVSIRDLHALKDFKEERVHCWLKLYMLAIATSYRIKEEGRTFKSEYIISQAIMMACKKLGYDGIAYYSKRVDDEIFALCAINLALFVNYKGKYSDVLQHMKMDDPFNFALYKQLWIARSCPEYELRAIRSGNITNIGNYERQFSYSETTFCDFDKFLFATWADKMNGKQKDQIPWGISTD